MRTTDQRTPFQRSPSVLDGDTFATFCWPPTAQHVGADRQDTPHKVAEACPEGSGLLMMVHAECCQRSTIVRMANPFDW